MKINNIIFNILLEQPSFDEKSKPIVSAIKNRNPVTFYYSGPRSPKKDSVVAGGRFRAEIVAMGLSKKGNLIVRAWVEPPSRSKKGFSKGNWRTFMVNRMSSITVFDDRTFDVKRPGYKEGDDKSMTVTYVKSSWTSTPPVKPKETPKPVEPVKPKETLKPVEPVKPKETPKPEEPKKVEPVKPEELPQPKPEKKPEPPKKEPKPTEPELKEPEKIEEPKPEEKPEDEKTELNENTEKTLETDKATMYGIYTDYVLDDTYEENDGFVELPEKGFLITGVQLKDGFKKGEGSGQEIYKKALDKYKVLYSTFPTSKDAMRVHDKLEEKGIANIEMVDLPNDIYLRKITKIQNSSNNQLQESVLRFKSLYSYNFYL